MLVPSARAVGLSNRGRCVLAGGAATAVCAVLLDERDLLRIGAFGALLPLLALLLVARTRRTVRARRTLVPSRIGVDDAARVELRLSGGALLGVLRLADPVPDAAGPAPDAPPRFLVSRIPRRGELELGYPLRPPLRGVHRIGPLHGRATDPLGLAEFTSELAGADRLMVLPRVVPLRGLPVALGGGEGTAGAALARQGRGVSDVLVRPYRYGDELRRVHWRNTARHDELMVRQEERPWRGGTTVLLDRRDAAHRGHGPAASLEFAISLAASVGVYLIGRGDPVTLLTEDGVELTGAGSAGGTDALLDALAALRPSARRELAGPELRPDAGLVAVLGALGPGELDALLARRSGGGHAVLLDTATWGPANRDAPHPAHPAHPAHRDPAIRDPANRDSRNWEPANRDPVGRDMVSGDPARCRPPSGSPDVAATAATLRRAGWEVVVAAAGATPDTVWAELTRSDRAAGVP